MEEWINALPQAKPDERVKLAQKIVGFFHEHIAPHAEWEERVLYNIVDTLAGGGDHRFTASMRYEHRLVERWTKELLPLIDASMTSEQFDQEIDRLGKPKM